MTVALLRVRDFRSAALALLRVFVLGLLLVLPAQAQAPDELTGRLDGAKAELAQIEATLQRDDLKDTELQALRARVDPVKDQLLRIIRAETPRLESAKSRLDQLGPPPDPAKGGSESVDVGREREDIGKLQAQVDDQLRLARLLSVQADQIQERISARRRAEFTRELLRRSSGILSPSLLSEVAQSAPREVAALRTFAANSVEQVWGNLNRARLIITSLVLLLVLLGVAPLRKLVVRLERRDPDDVEPSRRRRAMAAIRIFGVRTGLSLGLAYAAISFLDVVGLASGSLLAVLTAFVWAVAVVALTHGLARAVLAPEAPAWRLFGDDPVSVEKLDLLSVVLPAMLGLGLVLDALGQATVAPLSVTVFTRGVLSALIALTTLKVLRSMHQPPAEEDDPAAVSSPAVPTKLPFRLVVGLVACVVLAAALLGYVAFASFVVGQLVWVVCVLTALALLLVLIDEVVGYELSVQGRLGGLVQATVGVGPGSLQQVGILSAGVLRLALWVAALLLILAPWGIDGADATSVMRAAFFGFTIGGTTISLQTIAIALGLFVAGVLVTRSVQGWVESQYLPHTGLDPGLRNSIVVILGYAGVIVTAIVAFGELGLSLEKLTIVAGALSVGIGFGLQSIVNNFVSGLILLWERPIRVGDWVTIGSDQGIVRRINVRATEIATFDRASLIVPNSEFISGRVKNWVHADRVGRILIPVGVAYGADPAKVEKILTDVMLSHREVLSEPKPRVLFVRLADSTLDFEMICFADVDSLGAIKSDLLFEVVRRLAEEGIDIPFPRRTIDISNMDVIGDVLGRLTGDRKEPAPK